MRKKASQSGRSARRSGSEDAELELVINEIAADQAVVRIVLQSFLLRVLAVRAEMAPRVFAELQDHVFRSIDAIPLARDDAAGGARWKRLVVASAEKLFGEISDTLDSAARDGAMRN